MADLNKIYLFRMTHIDNIPHIAQFGITHGASPNRNPTFQPIGDSSLIQTRNQVVLANGRKLGDFIPFYFGPRMPMLYVISKGFNNVPLTASDDIVYCVSTVQKVLDHEIDFIFTDGHAVDSLSRCYGKADIKQFNTLLDFKAINARFWKSESDLDLKRRKEAEFLIVGDLPLSAIAGYVVFQESAKTKLKNWGIDPDKIAVKPDYYF